MRIRARDTQRKLADRRQIPDARAAARIAAPTEAPAAARIAARTDDPTPRPRETGPGRADPRRAFGAWPGFARAARAGVVLAIGLGAAAFLDTPAAHAQSVDTEAGTMRIEPVVRGLDQPWAFGWLPDGTLLVTERDGRLLAVADGAAREVGGLPDIAVTGQGGLLDLMVPRDFAESREIFLTFAAQQGLRGAGTAVFRGRLSTDGTRLENGEVIFEIERGSRGGFHFGSRLVEARDGHLFLTVGDRGDPDEAQNLGTHHGSVLRITRDGTAPADNPLVGVAGALPEIWSYGHRNPQGAALDLSGQLWINEHGARGGDEINRIRPGVNYGWPVISYGVNYDGSSIGVGQAQEGLEQPVSYWDPSIAPSGMTFYDGAVAAWSGDAFVGSLKFGYISRLSGSPLTEVERIESAETARVRDVREGPDGALWFLSVGNGALYRITPAAPG